MINILNDSLSVKISEKGAELQSLLYNEREYIWQANATYWAKHSPVLFPVVGELKDGKYIFENTEYKMPRHGFARDKVFEATQTSASSAVFKLKSDVETLRQYPFRFMFTIEYKLEATSLSCTYIVENTDTKAMYFSVGGHPAFNVPLQSKLHYPDYTLKFSKDNVLNRYLLHDGLTGDDTEVIPLFNNELNLQSSLFYADAIVLKNINSRQVELHTSKGSHGLKFSFEGFPYFGIWAAKDAPFVCLEPWCGIADNIHHDYQLENKEGINKLNVAESWQKTWRVNVF